MHEIRFRFWLQKVRLFSIVPRLNCPSIPLRDSLLVNVFEKGMIDGAGISVGNLLLL